MKVWVIMGNDFPEAVYATESEADADVQARKNLDEMRRKNLDWNGPRIYWRAYEFEMTAKETA